MADAGQMWQDVGQRFTELGNALKARVGGNAPAAGDTIDDAVRSIVAAAGRLGDRAAEVGRDPEVRATAQNAARSLTTALAKTLADAGVTISGWLEQQGFTKGTPAGGRDAGAPEELTSAQEPRAIGTASSAPPDALESGDDDLPPTGGVR